MVYEDVLQPALKAAREWINDEPADPVRRKMLALLLAARARLFWNNPYAKDLPVPERARWEQTRAFYEEACSLYPTKDSTLAGYLVWQGYLLAHGGRVEDGTFKKLLDLAHRAGEAESDFPGTSFLKGLAFHYRAVNVDITAIDDQVLQDEDQAIPALSEAINKTETKRPTPQLLDLYYSTRSDALVLRANCLQRRFPGQREKYQPDLEKALTDADARLTLRSRLKSHALMQRAHALEDLAWLCQKSDDYEAALEAFSASYAELPLNPDVLTGRARTYLKRGKSSDLPKAEKDLLEASSYASANGNTVQEGEARLWLSRVYLTKAQRDKGTYAKAIGQMDKVLQIASGRCLKNALELVVPEEAAAGEAAKRERDLERAIELAGAVRNHATQLRTKLPSMRVQATALLVRGWRLEGDVHKANGYSTRAMDAYRAAARSYTLALEEPKMSALQQVELLLSRSELVCELEDLRKEDLRRKQPTCVSDAELAVVKAKDANLEKTTRARALYGVARARYYSYFTERESAEHKALDGLERAKASCEEAIRLDATSQYAPLWNILAARIHLTIYSHWVRNGSTYGTRPTSKKARLETLESARTHLLNADGNENASQEDHATIRNLLAAIEQKIRQEQQNTGGR
jgi:hypothetical protein